MTADDEGSVVWVQSAGNGGRYNSNKYAGEGAMFAAP